MPDYVLDPVIAPDALLTMGTAIRVLDARPESAFAEGHAPGAIRLPIEAWERTAKTAEGALANPAFWGAQIGALGVSGATPVAVLDDGRITEAARAWFIIQHFGVSAWVVDGGWPALEPLLRAAGTIETPTPAPRRPAAVWC